MLYFACFIREMQCSGSGSVSVMTDTPRNQIQENALLWSNVVSVCSCVKFEFVLKLTDQFEVMHAGPGRFSMFNLVHAKTKNVRYRCVHMPSRLRFLFVGARNTQKTIETG